MICSFAVFSSCQWRRKDIARHSDTSLYVAHSQYQKQINLKGTLIYLMDTITLMWQQLLLLYTRFIVNYFY